VADDLQPVGEPRAECLGRVAHLAGHLHRFALEAAADELLQRADAVVR